MYRASIPNRLILAAPLGLALSLGACATPAPPAELVNAREAYRRAEAGLASKFVPDQLIEAKKALDRAENEFKNEPKEQRTRDFAYVALRKAQTVVALANIAEAKSRAEGARTAFEKTATGELKRTRAALQSERQARLEAEKRVKQAMESLARLAKVKKEKRGLVITLSGSVLFPSGKADLLPGAQARLQEVATALKEQGRNVIVEGHTDSRGRYAFNMDLSLRRAQSVRSYLVSQGVPADSIKATGIGPDRPVDTNATPEGRANNRRVEIIIEEPK